MGRKGGEDDTFTLVAASPGGLRSVERFAAVGEAGGRERISCGTL